MTKDEKKTREWVLRLIAENKLVVNWRETCIPGTLAAEATLPHWPMPVGTVHFRTTGNATIEILYSHVLHSVRRCGIRTKIHETLISWYPKVTAIQSGRGTKEGLAWMKATGYRQAGNGDWVLKVKR